MDCILCTEPMSWGDDSGNKGEPMHRICCLREVMGGIGHHIAHEYWCLQKHDPDAGLTKWESARLVDEYIAVVGVEAAVERSMQ